MPAMRSVRVLATSAVILAFASVQAQDSFPDVPANHWAYEGLGRMKKEGLLVGYPDGLFRGGRPASRYEFAVAMHAVYTDLKNRLDGLTVNINYWGELAPPQASAAEVQALKDAVSALQSQLAAMKGYGEDIAVLRRASETFEKELTQLGIDVRAMKGDLRGLADRVEALEKKRPKIDISGTLDLWMGGSHGLDDHYGLSRDGRFEGASPSGAVPNVFLPVQRTFGITDNLSFLQEAAVTLKSTNETGVKLKGTFVASNGFGQSPQAGLVSDHIGFGNQSDLFSPVDGSIGVPGIFGYSDGNGDLYIQELTASFAGKGFNFDAGRVRHQATPWILWRIDNTSYFENERWDDGKYTFDGAIFDTKVGPVKTEIYGGKNSSVRTANGIEINPLRSGPIYGIFGGSDGPRLEAEKTLGATLETSVKGVKLRGDYLILDTSTPLNYFGGKTDHVDVYGGQVNYNRGRFRFEGGLRQTQAFDNSSPIHVTLQFPGVVGSAWDAKVGWTGGRYDLSAQYREVGFNYLAPGDWGRLGVLRNPTNVRGFIGNAKVAFSPRYALALEGEFSMGLENDPATNGTFFSRDTNIDRYAVRFDAKLSENTGAYVTYEQTGMSDLNAAPDARYQWYGVGLKHQLSGNASFNLAYEQSAIKNDYQMTGVGGNAFRGGFLTSQISIKF